MATMNNGQDVAPPKKQRAAGHAEDWQVWELYGLIGIAILSTALIVLGNDAPISLWLLAVLAAAILQALVLPASAAWFGALAAMLAWVLVRQAGGVWLRPALAQIVFEMAGLGLSLLLAIRFRRHWEEQRAELNELRQLRQVLVTGEPGTGLLSRGVAELRIAEEVDRARQFRRPLGLLMVEMEPLPGHTLTDAELGEACQAVTRQLASAALVHDIPFRIDQRRLALLLPERSWEKLYQDAETIVQALRRATYPDSSGKFRPVAHHARLSFGLSTYQGEVAGPIDLLRAAEDSLAISRDLADIGQAPVTAYALPAAPIVESRLRSSDEVE